MDSLGFYHPFISGVSLLREHWFSSIAYTVVIVVCAYQFIKFYGRWKISRKEKKLGRYLKNLRRRLSKETELQSSWPTFVANYDKWTAENKIKQLPLAEDYMLCEIARAFIDRRELPPAEFETMFKHVLELDAGERLVYACGVQVLEDIPQWDMVKEVPRGWAMAIVTDRALHLRMQAKTEGIRRGNFYICEFGNEGQLQVQRKKPQSFLYELFGYPEALRVIYDALHTQWKNYSSYGKDSNRGP